MRKFNLLLITILFGINIFGQEVKENLFSAKWHNGFKIESADKSFKLKFGGRIQMDWSFFNQDDTLNSLFGNLNNTMEFRRIRFFNSGLVYKNLAYKVQFDFAHGKATFKDAFIALKKIPLLGNLKVGHVKEPLRLEVQTSSKYLLLMERANVADFVPERSTGIMFHNTIKNRFTYAIGTFRTTDSFGNDYGRDDESVTGRITGLPFIDEDKNMLLHLGGGFSHRNSNTDTYKVEAKPESHMGPKYVSTGTIANVDNVDIFSSELAFVWGSFSVQGEYLGANISSIDSVSSYSFSSYYAAVSFFLTGEHRNYLKSAGAFGRVSPKNNYDGEGGIGAIELVARYSETNLNSEIIEGGDLKDITLGVNWYLNPVTRVMFNYILADLNRAKTQGKDNIAQIRFQIDF